MKNNLSKKNIVSILLCITLFSFAITSCKKNHGKSEKIKIGTAEVMDLLNPTGRILARIINADVSRNDITATAITTGGVGENARMLLNGSLDCALVNDLIAVMAYRDDGSFTKFKNNKSLRSMCSFFTEDIIFVVNPESGIKNFKDIKGKKIGIVAAGSASIGDICEYILKYYKIKDDDFTRLPYNFAKSVEEFEAGNLDGFLYITAQPNPYLTGLTNSKKVKCEFIPFSKDLMEYIKSKYPNLTYVKIPADMYLNSINQEPVTTLGTQALLIATTKMDDDTAYYITKEICTYFTAFESVHPSFEKVTPKTMVQSLEIPVHPGSLKYYREAGLINLIPQNLR